MVPSSRKRSQEGPMRDGPFILSDGKYQFWKKWHLAPLTFADLIVGINLFYFFKPGKMLSINW